MADLRSEPRPGEEKNRQANHEMVTLARESRGLTQAELAARVSATQSHVSKIESGAISPPDEILEKIASELRYPLSFFYQTGRTYGPSVSEFFHRKRASVAAKTLNRIHAQINIRRLQLNSLLRSADLEESIPRLDPEEFGGDVEEIARAVRARWQLPIGPIKDVVSVIEDAGGVVIRLRFDTNLVDAVSWWVPGGPPLFVVNDSLPADRERLTLCHELGHLVMHEDLRPEMEDEANRFASAFLMPADDIKGQLHDVSLHALAGLKTRWRVSMQALLKRAEQLGTVTSGQARSNWIRLSRAGYRTREPAELNFAKEQPRSFQELVDLHCQDLNYSLEQIANLLNWEDSEVLENFSVHGFAPDHKPRLRLMK